MKGWIRGFGGVTAWLCRRKLERENDGAQHIGVGARRGERDEDARAGGAFHGARSYLEQPQVQGPKLGSGQSCCLVYCLLDAPQPCGGEAHLIGIGRAALGAITGELGFVQLDQVPSLSARALERDIDVLG